ncbi:uncharacterized protein BDR25DRAFT_347853 [Lindgomyces ingoldianus]|uniref:Uncharacterized protein n=1 Tax=Lindgomyces ingoldianus TaxID=673940 RepID=A0ACB6RGN9_9PLEO|nr:uncharacterized protein BDR25DRAFT_347853 [Lindgomyces ingoldianus]KAF2477500.1 hypothetical protein BDR25DRAFT_347853 [Lindgomyces ingoldianus]
MAWQVVGQSDDIAVRSVPSEPEPNPIVKPSPRALGSLLPSPVPSTFITRLSQSAPINIVIPQATLSILTNLCISVPAIEFRKQSTAVLEGRISFFSKTERYPRILFLGFFYYLNGHNDVRGSAAICSRCYSSLPLGMILPLHLKGVFCLFQQYLLRSLWKCLLLTDVDSGHFVPVAMNPPGPGGKCIPPPPYVPVLRTSFQQLSLNSIQTSAMSFTVLGLPATPQSIIVPLPAMASSHIPAPLSLVHPPPPPSLPLSLPSTIPSSFTPPPGSPLPISAPNPQPLHLPLCLLFYYYLLYLPNRHPHPYSNPHLRNQSTPCSCAYTPTPPPLPPNTYNHHAIRHAHPRKSCASTPSHIPSIQLLFPPMIRKFGHNIPPPVEPVDEVFNAPRPMSMFHASPRRRVAWRQ